MMNKNDVSYLFFSKWAEQNIKIAHPKYGLINWKMYPYMEQLAKSIEDHRFVIVNKFRQGGISTFTIAHALWEALWSLDKTILFLAKTDREAMCLGYMMRQMINTLPEQPQLGWVKPTKCNDHEICFEETNSKIWFFSPQAACGKSISHLYIDEAAFIENMDIHWKALWPALSRGASCTVVSTTNSTNGWFYDTFTDACEGKNDFHQIQMCWRDHPEYGNNPKWEQQMIENLGPKGFLQEMAGVFLPPLSKENSLYEDKMDKLETKQQQIVEVTKQYSAVVDKIEKLIGQPISQEIDGQLKILTPDGVESVALQKLLKAERQARVHQEQVAEAGYHQAYEIIMDLRNKLEDYKELGAIESLKGYDNG